ncbi:hypothetical protein C0580_04360 [Candidatus Parcubacteria bacterium]|nr:MAG: hypothetical protein C0580_04360 [Candidatus Parcubacteria bacterium]
MKFLKYKIILLIALFPLLVSADEWYGLEEAAGSAGLITRRPADVTTNIVNASFLFLGSLFGALIIFGGFKWMTSQGNRDQIQEAKDLIRNAAIGFAIVLVAFGITRYIIAQLAEATDVDHSGASSS